MEFLARIEEYLEKHRGNRWVQNREILDESFREVNDHWWMANRSDIENYENNHNRITIIGCNYLKDIRHELLEEDNSNPTNNFNNEIIHVDTKVEGIPAKLMIDTGSVSYTHLDRVDKEQTIWTS